MRSDTANSGRRKCFSLTLSDAELVCLTVAQVLLGARSEHWLRLCYAWLGHLLQAPFAWRSAALAARCAPVSSMAGRTGAFDHYPRGVNTLAPALDLAAVAVRDHLCPGRGIAAAWAGNRGVTAP